MLSYILKKEQEKHTIQESQDMTMKDTNLCLESKGRGSYRGDGELGRQEKRKTKNGKETQEKSLPMREVSGFTG